jgi:hypothetical protein
VLPTPSGRPGRRFPYTSGVPTSAATARSVTDEAAFPFFLRAFVMAAAASVVTTVVLFAYLAIAGLVAAFGGGLAALPAGSPRAMRVFSVGCGLLVGPVLYLTLWALTG